MGYGRYSTDGYNRLKKRRGYHRKSRAEIFESRQLDPHMDPRRVKCRESRDSEEHPESVPIIIALDVTGSMGMVPEDIVKDRLPDLMDTLMQAGVADPQILFLGIGDFVYDSAPLQVGQFESSTELLDRWLTKVYLEGGGGGNNQESYNLAYLFAARHTAIDSWDKRQQKGFLFTIGDEPCARNVPGDVVRRLTTAKVGRKVATSTLVEEARQRYHLIHLHVEHDAMAKTEQRKAGWRELLGTDFVTLEDYQDLAKTIATLVVDQLTKDKGPTRPAPDKALPSVRELLTEEML